MKKTIKLQDLDCANCAAKIENAISKLDYVNEVKINFMSQKMILDAPDDKFDAVFTEAQNIARKIDSGIEFVS